MSGWQWAFAIWAAVTSTVGALLALARTPPDIALSTLSEWAKKIGFHRIPGWLRRAYEFTYRSVTYRWALRALVALILVGIGLGIYYLTSSRTAQTIPSVVPPLPTTQTRSQPMPAIPEGGKPAPQRQGLPELNPPEESVDCGRAKNAQVNSTICSNYDRWSK